MDKLQHYQWQTQRLQQKINILNQKGNRWSLLRLASFGLMVAISATALFTLNAFWFTVALLLFGALFITTIIIHRRIETHLAEVRTLRSFKQTQIARLTIYWEDLPPALMTQLTFDHPFEADLDLIGERSVHRLLDTTTTEQASERFRTWLTEIPTIETILQRQQLVQELGTQTLFRTKLAVYGQLLSTQIYRRLNPQERENLDRNPSEVHTIPRWHTDTILKWFTNPESAGPTKSLQRWLGLLSVLTAINWIVILIWAIGGPSYWAITLPVYGVLMLYATYFQTGVSQSQDLFREASKLHQYLQWLTTVFLHLETTQSAKSPKLMDLLSPFHQPEERPSLYIKRLARVTSATGIRGNPVLWFLLNMAVPWDVTFAYLFQKHRAALAVHLPQWMDVWHELEVLCALANVHHLQPTYTMPDITDSQHNPLFVAESLGHPLLPEIVREGETAKVRNDYQVDALGQVAIITGSNMAGKSTFLKAVGVNLALAYAGGPVDATTFQIPMLRLFTSIRVSDSVTDGFSYFYAEVRRLKALLMALDESDDLPLFFLIDEIFRGTNNQERRVGSWAYISALSGKHGIGLISTHDLELVHLADEDDRITNYHFRDDVVDGQMVFDYKMRPGPCPTTNALKIMALEGLPVE
ncbi:MAG: hypothetical protein AAF639_03525 [Chloroflexota bacterium]